MPPAELLLLHRPPSRSEYWWFYLFTLILSLVAGFIGGLFGDTLNSVLTGLVSLGLLLPSMGVMFRRLHDTGHTGWWWLIAFTGIGALFAPLLVCTAQPARPQQVRRRAQHGGVMTGRGL